MCFQKRFTLCGPTVNEGEVVRKVKNFKKVTHRERDQKNFKAKLKCDHCQAEGGHYTALSFSKNDTPNSIAGRNNHPSTSNDTEETDTCLAKNNTMILLQTASGCIMNITEEQFCVVNVLLDTGSQQTFTPD